jgi:Fur family zinc uptake transcriptional regulator
MTHTHELTRNQSFVLDALRAADRPMSAYEVMDRTASKGVKAPPQIYRALEKLIEYGLVHRIESLNAYTSCDHEGGHGDVAFALCRACESVTEIPLTKVKSPLLAAARSEGFSVSDMHIEMFGLCDKCRPGLAGKS